MSVFTYNTFSSLDVFFHHAPQFGFFLNMASFRHSALLAFNLGHPLRPTPGLLSVVHLLGVHFSQPETLQGQESALLTRALQHVATDLIGTHPNKVIHTLQAEILLSYYFFRTGLLLEAKHRAAAAVSLALGSGLHKIRSSNFMIPSTIGIGPHDQAYGLAPPSDSLQEAERINGFWAALMLHKFLTVALEPPANVCGALEAPGMQIDTPWPVDIDKFEEVFFSPFIILQKILNILRQTVFPPELQGNSTVRAFLNGALLNDQSDSATTSVVKAAILFHRAAHLTGQWSPSELNITF